MSVQKEGTITFWLRHEDEDWPINSNGYRFPTVTHDGISVEPVKLPDKTMEVRVYGLLGQALTFRNPIPPCDERGLFVVITWKAPEWVKLYFNGNPIETRQTN